MRRWIAPATVLLALLVVWEVIVRAGAVNALLLPAPSDIASPSGRTARCWRPTC